MYKDIFDKITVDENLKQKIEERIDKTMNKKRRLKPGLIAAAACLALAVSATAIASYRYLSARQVAEEFGDKKLAAEFDNSLRSQSSASISHSNIRSDGNYRATLLGVCSGKNISDFVSSTWDLFPERTYAAVAVERLDGEAMTYDDQILVTPLIKGLEPWEYNILTMNGSYTAGIIDGVLYRIIECDTLEYFADRGLYIAVCEGTFYPNDGYILFPETGEIAPNPEFDGANMIMPLYIDESKADPVKAAEYMEQADTPGFGGMPERNAALAEKYKDIPYCSLEANAVEPIAGDEKHEDPAAEFDIRENEITGDGEATRLIEIRKK